MIRYHTKSLLVSNRLNHHVFGWLGKLLLFFSYNVCHFVINTGFDIGNGGMLMFMIVTVAVSVSMIVTITM